MTEKEEATVISKEKVERLCKCWSKPKPPTLKRHTKEVFSDGWTKFICSTCGQVSFTRETRVRAPELRKKISGDNHYRSFKRGCK